MTRLAGLATLLLALAVSACGGGDDAPTKAEFAKAAEKVCAKAEKAVNGIGEGASTPAEKAAAVDKLIAATQNSVDEMKALDRPDGTAGEAAEKFIDSLASDIEDKGIPALEKLRDGIEQRDAAAVQKAGEELGAIDSANTDRLARAAGAKSCAN
jgi:hypothetical protein